jgi:hypothetical protein
MAKEIKDTAIEAAKQVRAAIHELQERREVLSAEQNSLEERNALLLSLPVPRDELKTLAKALIDKMAYHFMVSGGLADAFSGLAFPKGMGQSPQSLSMGHKPKAMNLAMLDAILQASSFDELDRSVGFDTVNRLCLLGGPQSSTIKFAPAFCFLHGDALKERIDQNFETVCPSIEKAPAGELQTLDERRAEIHKNQVRIGAIVSEVSRIDQRLEELDVRV